MSEPAPHQLAELRTACRHLVRRPLVLAERDPEVFALVRRHEHTLDRWFTQRFGYRLQVTADTARLFKTTWVASRRPLYTVGGSSRALVQREYTLLALALAAVAAGPDIISLRDLIHEVRSAAIDAEVVLTTEGPDRRALVNAVKWMVAHGLVDELHERVDRYATDEAADAVLRIRPDRVALLPLPALASSATADELLDRQRHPLRAWMRSQLLEEPVLYRSDLDESEWAELRRRLGEELAIFAEMFGVAIEVRGEGLAVVDEEGTFSDSAFPRTGTVGHAALLVLAELTSPPGDGVAGSDRGAITIEAFTAIIAELGVTYRKYWSQLATEPEKLAAEVLALLIDQRLAVVADGAVCLLPAAWRYALETALADTSDDADDAPLQGSLL